MRPDIKSHALLFVCLLAIGGCAHHPPRYADGPGTSAARDALLSSYDRAWRSFSGKPTGDIGALEMVHPGIPSGDGTVRLWYLLSEAAIPDDRWDLDVSEEDAGSDHARSTRISIKPGPVNPVHHTGYVDVTGLEPDRVYRLELRGGVLSRTHTMTIRTPPPDSSRGVGMFSFLVSSCFLPWAAERGGLTFREETRSVMSSLLTRANAPIEHRPAFHLKLGDQIYTDGGADGGGKKYTAAYLRGSSSDSIQSAEGQVDHVFDRLYRYNFGLPPMDASMKAIPTAMMIDDHEVRDGWGSYRDEHEKPWLEFYGKGLDAFQAFQASRNPGGGKEIARPFELRREMDSFHFSFNWGPAARFFVFDTRSRTGCDEVSRGRRGAICGGQLDDFRKWLDEAAERTGPTLLVVALAVPLTLYESDSGRWTAQLGLGSLADDSADRLTDKEREGLLRLLAEHLGKHGGHRLLVLSGDVHYSGITTLRLNGEIRGYEIISSGLAQQEFKRASSLWGSNLYTKGPFHVTSHGVDAVPSFAEIFVAPRSDASAAPEVKVLFYPGARQTVHWWQRIFKGAELTPWVLEFPSDQGALRCMALPPERHPTNSRNWLGYETSRLAEELDRIWAPTPHPRCIP